MGSARYSRSDNVGNASKVRKKRRKDKPYYACGYSKEEWTEKSRLKYRSIRKEIVEKLGNKCTICGFDDFRALQIDHVLSGNGLKERKEKGWSYLKQINKIDAQVLLKDFQCIC